MWSVNILVDTLTHIMRAFIFIMLLIAVHTATSSLEKITEKVHAGLKSLKEKAAQKLHKLTEEIDFKKLPKLDVKKLFPHEHKHFVHEQYSKKTPFVIDPYQVQRLKHYFEPHHHKPVHTIHPISYHHIDHIHQ